MKVLIDTNIIVDVALERQPFYPESVQVISLAYQKQISGYLSASTWSDIYYIIRKQKGRELTLDFLRRIRTICQVATVNDAAIDIALAANQFRDFEDAIQYATAIANQFNAIVTRNPQDFPVVSPRILTPSQLIEELGNLP